MEIKINNLIKSLILFTPFVAFYNIEFIDGFGLIEIYIDIVFFISLFRIRIPKKYLFFGILIFSFNVIGVLLSHTFYPLKEISIVSIGFIYKNFKIYQILVIYLCVRELDFKFSIENYLKLILINFIIWTIFYVFFLNGLVNSFVASRVSFPFGNYEQSNAHLYSYCFGFIICAYLIINKNVTRTSVILITVISVILIQFTGSRNYIIALLVPTLTLYSSNVLKFIYKSKFVLISLIILFIILLPNISNYLDYERIAYSIERVYNFNLQSDSSAIGRINKFFIGIEYFINGPILLGIPISFTPIIWFDGIIPSVLIQYGIIGFLMIFFWIIMLLLDESKKELKFLLVYIIIGNLITEFVYVSRGLILTVFLYLIIKQVINKNKLYV